MKVKIIATAPTAYQLNSLNAFNLGMKQNGNGSFTGSSDFDTIVNARKHLIEQANRYNDSDGYGSPKILKEMIKDIKKHNCLSLDAVTAHICEIDKD
jgi:hypothetical protein